MPHSPSREKPSNLTQHESPARLATSLFTTSFATRPTVIASAPGPGQSDWGAYRLQRWSGPAGGSGAAHRAWPRAADQAGPSSPTRSPRFRRSISTRRCAGSGPTTSSGWFASCGRCGLRRPGRRSPWPPTLPIGAGLSSSAALTVALAKALSLLAGRRLSPAAAGRGGLSGGIPPGGRPLRPNGSDHRGARASGARRSSSIPPTGALRQVPFPGRLWVVETGVSHRLTGGALNERRRECEEALAFCREWRPGLVHLAQLSPADLPEIGAPATASPGASGASCGHRDGAHPERGRRAGGGRSGDRWAGCWSRATNRCETDYQSTIPEADFIVESAVEHGAYGARLTGAGWGGAVVVLAPAEREARMVAEIGGDFEKRFQRLPVTWSTRASRGVRRETIPD